MPKKKQTGRRRKFKESGKSIISDEINIPNHSGDHSEGRVDTTPTVDLDLVNKKYVDDEIIDKAWLLGTAQTGLTGDKTGSFNLTTTGEGGFGGLMPYDSAAFDLGSVGLKWRNLMMSGDITTLGTLASGAPTFDLTGGETATFNNQGGDTFTITSFATGATRLRDALSSIVFESGIGTYRFTDSAFTQQLSIDPTSTKTTIETRRTGIPLYFGTEQIDSFYIDGSNQDVNFLQNVNITGTTTTGNLTANGNVILGVNLNDMISINGEVDTAITGTDFKITLIGGYTIKLTNRTGSNTVKGQLVTVYTATAIDDAFKTQVASGDNTIGVVLEAGVSNGEDTWIVVGGKADVLIDAGGSARGDRMITSATAGSADVWNVGGAVADHFLEIGHCVETRIGAGLARCVLHFN